MCIFLFNSFHDPSWLYSYPSIVHETHKTQNARRPSKTLVKRKVKVTKLCPTLETPWTVACQAPLSMGFSRQECWSGFPFPSPGDLLDPGIEPSLLHCRQILYQLSYEGSPNLIEIFINSIHIFEHISWLVLEKEMATQSSTLAWKIPWTEKPGKL